MSLTSQRHAYIFQLKDARSSDYHQFSFEAMASLDVFSSQCNVSVTCACFVCHPLPDMSSLMLNILQEKNNEINEPVGDKI